MVKLINDKKLEAYKKLMESMTSEQYKNFVEYRKQILDLKTKMYQKICNDEKISFDEMNDLRKVCFGYELPKEKSVSELTKDELFDKFRTLQWDTKEYNEVLAEVGRRKKAEVQK